MAYKSEYSICLNSQAALRREGSRVRSLQALSSYLIEAERNNLNNKCFTMLFNHSVTTLELDPETVSRELKISHQTAKRWEEGKSAPHPLGRSSVFRFLRRIAKEKLRFHQEITF